MYSAMLAMKITRPNDGHQGKKNEKAQRTALRLLIILSRSSYYRSRAFYESTVTTHTPLDQLKSV
jgi:hypothetical protein